jgi:hypothetical protein
MNQTPSSPNSTGQPSKPKPQPRPLPASLREFLFTPDAPAKRFIAHVLRSPLPRPDTFAIEAMVRDVGNSPAASTKLAQAIAELPSPGSQIAQLLADLAEQISRAKASVTISIPTLSPATPLDELRRAVAAMGSVRQEKSERAKREQWVHFLLAAAWIKGAVTGPMLADILVALESMKPVGGDPDGALAALLVRNLNKPGPRAEALTVYLLQQARLSIALQERQALSETSRRLQAELDDLKVKIRELETQCSATSATVQERDGQIGRLTRDLADQQAVARQSRRALRSKFNGLLQGEISSLMRDAQAAAMEPVRPHIISDRLESLANIIKKETLWLESSE